MNLPSYGSLAASLSRSRPGERHPNALLLKPLMREKAVLKVGSTSPEKAAWTPSQALPAFLCIEGVEVVVVAKAVYLELMALRARATNETIAAAVHARKAPPPGLSTIEKDVEVADFLRDLFRGRMTCAAMQAACVTKFGKERAPLVGRIQTFRSRSRVYL